jgi:hypothetical protein
MKKTIKIMLTLALVIAALSITAAAEGTNGFYDIGTADNVAVSVFAGETAVTSKDANVDTTDDAAEVYYEGSDRLEVTYSAAANGSDYGVILVEGSGLPTVADDIYYINQVAATGENVEFNVYPKTIAETTDMTMYISSNAKDFELVSVPMAYVVGYEEVVEPTFTYGDVDDNGKINTRDVTKLAKFVIGGYGETVNELAANVKADTKINTRDVTTLAKFVIGGYFDPNVLPQ